MSDCCVCVTQESAGRDSVCSACCGNVAVDDEDKQPDRPF